MKTSYLLLPAAAWVSIRDKTLTKGKPTEHKGMHDVVFYLYEAQKQAKLICEDEY